MVSVVSSHWVKPIFEESVKLVEGRLCQPSLPCLVYTASVPIIHKPAWESLPFQDLD